MNHFGPPIDPRAVATRLPATAAVFAAEPRVTAAWVYGSVADGTATCWSDVDFLVLPDPAGLAAFGDERRPWGVAPGWIEDLVDALAATLGVSSDAIGVADARQSGAIDLGPALARSHLLFSRDDQARRQFERRVLQDGPLSPEAALRRIWLGRTARVRSFARGAGGGVWLPAVVRSAYGLGHLAIRVLGLPVPGARVTFPAVLAAAGVVSRRTAMYVQRLGHLFYRDCWHRLAFMNKVEDLLRHAWRFEDWAWSLQVALERAYWSAQAGGRDAGRLDPGENPCLGPLLHPLIPRDALSCRFPPGRGPGPRP